MGRGRLPARRQAAEEERSPTDEASGDLRDIGDQQQHQNGRRDHGQARPRDGLDADAVAGDAQAGGDEQVRADRGCKLADGEVDCADHAEVDRINAELLGNRNTETTTTSIAESQNKKYNGTTCTNGSE